MMTADNMYKGPALVMWNMIADINLWGKKSLMDSVNSEYFFYKRFSNNS